MCACVRAYVRTSVPARVCVRARARACVCVCVYVCVCVCVRAYVRVGVQSGCMVFLESYFSTAVSGVG